MADPHDRKAHDLPRLRLVLDFHNGAKGQNAVYEFISGQEVANMICDDYEFLQAYILGELTPYFKNRPQPYGISCVACVHAQDNGQPDPFVRCDTDPDPDTFEGVVDGYSRHLDCGFAATLQDTEFEEVRTGKRIAPAKAETYIVARLKFLSFNAKAVDLYFKATGTIPVISGQSFDETWNLVKEADFTRDEKLSDHEVTVQMIYHLWKSAKYHGWGKRQIDVVRFVIGESMSSDNAKKFFQRHVTPLLK